MANKKNNPEFVRLKIDFISVDRTQYKPYFSQLSGMDELFVDIPVGEFDIVEATHDGGVVVLSLEGLANIMVKVADSITAADDKARVKRFGH